jgi:magnesium chelatase subunit D
MNSAWDDSLWGLAALAVDPVGLKGIWLKCSHGPVKEEWLSWLFALRPKTLKLPSNVDTERLLGGLDLSMTLQLGHAVKQRGLLAQSHERLLLCPMAERLDESSASILTQVLDTQQVNSYFAHDMEETVFGFIAVDESSADERGIAPSLREQLGIWLDLNHCTHKDNAQDETLDMLERVERTLLKDPLSYKEAINHFITLEQDIHDVCELAQAFAIDSLRAPWFAIRLASVFAVLRGSSQMEAQDLGRAARMVLTPRATHVPNPSQDEPTQEQQQSEASEASEPTEAPENPPQEQADSAKDDLNDLPPTPEPPTQDESRPDSPDEPDDPDQSPEQETLDPQTVQALETSILEAALATLPKGLLSQLAAGHFKSKNAGMGRAGDIQKGARRGRPLPPLKGHPSNGNRLHVLATLRHAAPRQKIRALSAPPREATQASFESATQRIQIRSEDFHIQRFAKRSESCIIFCIDASGSAALQRLAEAKGAVELLLKDSYARRDHICVIGFRDKEAQVHLPITRSLLRAKRELQALPGGGGTPLANALKLCAQTSQQARQHGMTPTLVILSDGRANVTLQGEGSRPLAKAQALTWAKQWRSLQLQSIWLDTSARPDPQAQEIAMAMDAHYVPLPHANSQRMANAVQLLKETRS